MVWVANHSQPGHTRAESTLYKLVGVKHNDWTLGETKQRPIVMSRRIPVPQPDQTRGSLYGDAFGVRDIWSSMAVSPQQSPASSPPTDPVVTHDATCSDLDMYEHQTRLTHVESAVLTWKVDLDEYYGAAYVFFELSSTPVVLSETLGTRMCVQPVLPQVVYADAISWQPIVTNTGIQGHGYVLSLEGTVQAMVEVVGGELVVCHSSYSPIGVECGLVSPSTRLCFGPQHPEQLERLVDDVAMDGELVFLPVNEMLAGRVLERLPLRVDAPDGVATEARRIWAETRAFLRSMNSTVLHAIDNHNRVELERSCVSPREIVLPNIQSCF